MSTFDALFTALMEKDIPAIRLEHLPPLRKKSPLLDWRECGQGQMPSLRCRTYDFHVWDAKGKYLGVHNGTRFGVKRMFRNEGLFNVRIKRKK